MALHLYNNFFWNILRWSLTAFFISGKSIFCFDNKFSGGANRLIFLTASCIFIVSFSFLSRSSKAYLILLIFHSWWCCELGSLSNFFSFSINFLFYFSLMGFKLMLISIWIDKRWRMFEFVLSFSMWSKVRFFSADAIKCFHNIVPFFWFDVVLVWFFIILFSYFM